MIGKEVPNEATWANFPPFAQYAFEGSDFLWTEEDPNQYKFHGADLEVINVFDINVDVKYTPDEYLAMLGMI